MEEKEWKKFVKAVAVMLWIMLTIITSAGACNYAYMSGEHFYTVCAVINAVVEGFVIYKSCRK